MSDHILSGRTEDEVLWFRRRGFLQAAAGWTATAGVTGAAGTAGVTTSTGATTTGWVSGGLGVPRPGLAGRPAGRSRNADRGSGGDGQSPRAR